MDLFRRWGRKSIISYKALFGVLSLRGYLLIKMIGPVLHLVFFALVAKYAYQTDDLSPWIIGNAMILTYFNALFGVGAQMFSERSIGTLKVLLATPSSGLGVFLPRAILHTLDGVLSISFGLLAGMVLFGFSMPVDQVPLFYLNILIGSFAAMCFGLLISSMGLLTRDLNMILNVASMTLLTFTGANIHIDKLPTFLQALPWWLPLTRSIAAGRLIHGGASFGQVQGLLVGELAMALAFAIGGYVLFKGIERLSIRLGTLDVY